MQQTPDAIMNSTAFRSSLSRPAGFAAGLSFLLFAFIAPLAAEQPVLLETLTKNTLLLIEKCGNVESSAILKVRGAGRTLKEVTCILNCQKRPMRWTVYVYFGEGRWQVLDAEVDLELHSFFEEQKSAAK